MIERYTVKEIAKIWSEKHKISVWAEIEELVVLAWSEIGVIPKEDFELIHHNLKINLKLMKELEKETKHDVVAFTRMLSESLGDERKWIHLGITSTDIVDTAQNYLIMLSADIIVADLKRLKYVLSCLAKNHKKTLTMGRSHGIYGEPTSLGLKFVLWRQELQRQELRIYQAFEDVCVTKISGSMGNYANLDMKIEEIVAEALDMPPDVLSTQVSQRDRLASLMLAFANLSTTLEKMATEIRLLQRSEVQEMMEGFGANQKGSSSMPHKKNPISSENITGLARMIRSYVIPSLENNVLWHERDISHSSNERIMIPDVLNLVSYSLRRMSDVLENLVINEDQMMKHILSMNNVFYSQPLMTYILIHTNHSREEVYDFIQKCTLETLETKEDFKEILLENNVLQYISREELDGIFNLEFFLRNVDEIYKKVDMSNLGRDFPDEMGIS